MICLTCSNCGAQREVSFSGTRAYYREIILDGWGSYGGALYCPECSRTWYKRNKKPMADDINTLLVIQEKLLQAGRGRRWLVK